MSHHNPAMYPGPLGPFHPPLNGVPAVRKEAGGQDSQPHERTSSIHHGEALARDSWAERYGTWIVLIFTLVFTLFLIIMNLVGQTPGKSFLLKSISDILQFAGECIGFIFCIRIAARLRNISSHLWHDLAQKAGHTSPNEIVSARTEAQNASRAFLAWTFLAIAIALYASGQALWTSYDIRMNSADVPFPGIYDIGFVGAYPFFLIGTLLLTRRSKATVGRARLVLDALGVIGTFLTLSWFFVLDPLIASLAQAPSFGAAFLSIYFPTGDLFLVAVGAFLMFSPLANRSQQPVFLRLCLGLFCLAITDSLLAYYNLSFSFNTGTLQDILWPLSMSLVGLAAIEYPRSIAHEQERTARTSHAGLPMTSLLTPGRFSQLITTIQTITPFILVLMTCAVLLTVIAPRGGALLIQADVIALALVLVVVARQALTLIENNRLAMQMRGELVISRRELQVTRREADEATRTAQEKRILEEGVATLREVHARVARGDFSARAPTIPGPLLPIAISLNLMLDRLSSLSQRGARFDQLVQECKMLQVAVERLKQGLPLWSPNQPAPQGSTTLRSTFLSLSHLQRTQESLWRRVASSVGSMHNLTRKLHEALSDIKHAPIFADQGQANFERMILERVIREVDLLEQQQRTLQSHALQASAHTEQIEHSIDPSEQIDPAGQFKQRSLRQKQAQKLLPIEAPAPQRGHMEYHRTRPINHQNNHPMLNEIYPQPISGKLTEDLY